MHGPLSQPGINLTALCAAGYATHVSPTRNASAPGQLVAEAELL
jgi:hypothetical protein